MNLKNGLLVLLVLAVCILGGIEVKQLSRGPKYPTKHVTESIGGNVWCISRCTTDSVLDISPNPLEGCEGDALQVTVRVLGRIDSNGDKVENSGGSIDWDDGTSNDFGAGNSWNFTHIYNQAKGYAPSARFAQQYTNANNPPGGCSYRCGIQHNIEALIYLKTSDKCKKLREKNQ
jgi:hypothetical protein